MDWFIFNGGAFTSCFFTLPFPAAYEKGYGGYDVEGKDKPGEIKTVSVNVVGSLGMSPEEVLLFIIYRTYHHLCTYQDAHSWIRNKAR